MNSCLRWCTIAVLLLTAVSCGDSPSAPTPAQSVTPPASPPATAPPGPEAMGQASGVVVDTDERPIAGAHLSAKGVDAYSDAGGAFAFSFPLSTYKVGVVADGYESHDVYWDVNQTIHTLRIVLQPKVVVRVGAADAAAVTLTNGDLSYYVGEAYDSDYCNPCKLIRLSGLSASGRARVTLHWRADGNPTLQMWASDGYNVTPAKTGEGRTQVVDVGALDWIYVGLPLGSDYRPQQLAKSTSFEIKVE